MRVVYAVHVWGMCRTYQWCVLSGRRRRKETAALPPGRVGPVFSGHTLGLAGRQAASGGGYVQASGGVTSVTRDVSGSPQRKTSRINARSPALLPRPGCESWPQPSIIAQCSTPKHGGTAESEHPSGSGVHTERLPAVSGCCPCRLYKPIKHKNALFDE